MKMHITKEWLRNRIEQDGDDECCEAGVLHPEAPRHVWLSKCATRYVEAAKITPKLAWDMAVACLENVDGDLNEDPAECADEDMSCWTND